MKPTLISIVGPTAIGKTRLAIDVAKHFNTEIISADSRQFYKEMSIGTAKPTPQELSEAPHHFVDFLPITELYSAGDFERNAIAKLDELFKTHPVVVMAGGSGMYVNAVCDGFDNLPDANLTIRKQLNEQIETEGIDPLLKQLEQLDPTYYNQVDRDNKQRVVRALEVCLSSGKPFSSFRKNTKVKRPFNIISIGLTWERTNIYDRINKRVDIMVNEGLIEEARRLYPQRDLNALQTVGYRELFAAFDGDCSVNEAIEQIKTNTRRFAKRQLTWFKRNAATTWFSREQLVDIIPFIEQELKA